MSRVERARRWALGRSWLRPVHWILDEELAGLALLALAAFGLWGFVEISDEVLEGETRDVEEQILLAMRSPDDPSDPIGPGWVEEIGRDLTAFGGFAALTLVTLFCALLLVLQQKRRTAVFLLASIVSGMVVSLLLKHGFARPRPDLVPHGSIVYTKSFPSGHSMLSATTYLTLAAIFLRTQGSRLIQGYLVASAVLLTVLVGVSRVYLGVHWPTDVLAGWAAGTVWACLAWIVARRLQILGAVEQQDEPEPAERP